MGPITGFRVVNLRVQERVAYPDLTINIGTGDHVVIGLENGGGKGTLLGFLLHIFLPEAQHFLPRLAQRRQGREGEEKRIEHYVPGGPPTHICVELELPADTSKRQGGVSRVLVGACLYKPPGAGPSTPAEEFFWSARCVTSQFTLASIGLRAEAGRLLDHREWRAWLDSMRASHPDAEIVIHDGKTNWGNHLRNALKIDVEFVKSWLLAMNKDEGAADHVFTYGSSRAFLNTLIKAVGDPDLLADINQGLTAMAEDADHMKIDRRREALLRRLVDQTGPLAEFMDQLAAHDRTRRSYIDSLLTTQNQLRARHGAIASELEEARRREHDTELAASDANTVHSRASTLELLARLQLAQLSLAAASARVEQHRADLEASEQRAQNSEAAAVQADLRTVRARIRDTEQLLSAKTQHAEPERRAASSAAQAWLARLNAELESLTGQYETAVKTAKNAQEAEDTSAQELIEAERNISRTEASTGSASKELERIEILLKEAERRGDLAPDQSVPVAQRDAAELAANLQEQAAQATMRRQAWQKDLDQLAQERSEFEAQAADCQAQERSARADVEEIRTVTGEVVDALTGSQLLDLDPINLDDHAEVIRETLAAAAASATARQLDAGIKAATAQRAVRSLETSGLLPPRADVVALCERASKARLGARPGWTYLAELPGDTAQRFAQARPGLADGVIVNVPEDFSAMVTLARECRAGLDGPVAIGAPSAFEETGAGNGLTALLPDEAFWSRHAGQQQVTRRHDEHERHQLAVRDEASRYERAVRLRERLGRWQTEIGPGAQADAEHRLADAQRAAEELPAARTKLQNRQQKLASHRDHEEAAADTFRQKAAAAQGRANRLTVLADQVAPRGELQQRIATLRGVLDGYETARDQAGTAMGRARSDRESASRTSMKLATMITQLEAARSDAEPFSAIVTHPGDPINPEDRQADRLLLAERTRALTDHWRGLTSDQGLQGELDQLGQQLKACEKLAREYEPAVAEAALAIVNADPSRASADFRRDAEQARSASLRLSRELGGLEEAREERSRQARQLAAEVKQLRRASQLSAQHTTADIKDATEIAARLLADRERATEERQWANDAYTAAATKAGALSDWLDLSVTIKNRLEASAAQLSPAGRLTDRVDTDDRAFELHAAPLPQDSPANLLALLEVFDQRELPLNAAKQRATRCADEISGETSQMQRILDDAGRRAEDALNTVEATLRSATDELIAGDKLIQVLRNLGRPALAANAIRHHHDASSRLAAVAHHVAQFNTRLERLAQTTFASIQHLVRSVKQTVAASQLPTTPAMGRWSGLNLLKISGLDSLNREQREAAILTTLQAWFDPDRTTPRPRFDTDSAISALVEAVTPRATATVLVPSDPLDTEHRPVESLAVTSGGEGVTVALILASLLAARRARNLGHRRTTLLLDNPFAKVNKPMFLRLARDVARSLGVQLVPLTGIRDLGALTVFPSLIQLRVSRRQTANAVVPTGIDDDRIQQLIREGTLYVSPTEWQAAEAEARGDQAAWPVMSQAEVHWMEPLELAFTDNPAADGDG